MKRFALASLLLLFLTLATAFPQGAEVIIKNKAKAIRDGNNARQAALNDQQPPPPPPVPGAPAAPATPVPRGPDPAQQARIDKLEADLSAIQTGARVPLDKRKEIMTDTAALARGAAKPSAQSVSNLVTHLALALADKGVTLKDPAPAQLARNFNIVVNSVNLTAGQVQPVIIATQNLLRAAAVPEDDYKPVVTDLKDMVTELQKNKPKP